MRSKILLAALLLCLSWSTRAQADVDNDGLPDDWEASYGLSSGSAADALIDSNGNGVINLLEYAFGGNPIAASSTPSMRASLNANNNLAVTFNRRINSRFSIQLERVAEVGNGSWTTDGFVLGSQRNLAADLEEVTYRLANSAPAQQFVRVAVRLLPRQNSLPQFVYRVVDSDIVHGQGVTPIDMDGDNDTDLVVAFSLTDSVYLYLNGGDGSTWSTVKIAPDNSIVAMQTAVADFDGDGDLDVAAVELFDRSCTFCAAGKIVWYERPANITGTWTRRSVTDTFWGGRFVSAMDVNGDGRADLVASANVINENGNGLFWFRNGGNGATWSAPIPIDAGLLQVEVNRPHDVDGNGVVDVVALGKNSNELAWYENMRASGTVNNTPTLTKRPIATPTAPDHFIFANIDADADLELLVSSAGGIIIYNRGADPRQPWTPSPVDATFGAGNNSRLFVVDFDGDGLTDIAAGSGSVGELRWYKNGGNGQWTARTIQTGYNGLTEVIGADLNRDGRFDLITSTYNFDATDRIAWWDNQSSDQPNRAPVLNAIGNRTSRAGVQLRFTASATDPDGNPITFSLIGPPTGASIDPQTGVFAWTPSAPGAYSATFVASDGSLTDSETIQIEVTEGGGPAPTLLRTTFDSAAAISSPAVGIGGTSTLLAADFVTGQTGNGASPVNGRHVRFPTENGSSQNIEFDRGEINFWFRPNFSSAADDDNKHAILIIGDIYGAPRLEISESDRINFTIVDGGYNIRGVQSEYHAPLFASGVWAHVRVVWDNASADSVQLYINDARIDAGGVAGGWSLGEEAALPSIFIGAANEGGEFPVDGTMDELSIR